ncbi:MAG: ATP-binding protein [Saprospiraceae bacterium]|nr:ATP-binding protein [Saprospiraceae bacterium]
MIERFVKEHIKDRINKNRAIVVIGARRAGKTTMINDLLSAKSPGEILFLNGDNPLHQNLLYQVSLEQIKLMAGSSKTIFIDEGQRINGLGITAKLIVDHLPDIQLFITGSSALDLNDTIKEPLTGRKWEYELLPISYGEFESHTGYLQALEQLDRRIIYGWYPEVINHPGDEVEILQELTSSYLYKDILALTGIRKPELLANLVQLLAYQIGSEVSYQELAGHLGVDKNTVNEYIALLEKAFVVFRLNSFSKNQRNEIKKGKKIYFYDTGIRNMLIYDFNHLSVRQDKGALWENFIIAEMIKKANNTRSLSRFYFWRTTAQQEIDLIQMDGQNLHAYEITYNANRKKKFPKSFIKHYQANTHVIHQENFRDFIVGSSRSTNDALKNPLLQLIISAGRPS